MPEDSKSAPDWSIEGVLKTLREKTRPGAGVSVHVFLDDHVSAVDLPSLVAKMVKSAQEKLGTDAPFKIGKIHANAKSFSVTAEPDAVAALAASPAVKSILPSEIEDVYPEPVKRSPA